MPGLTIRKLADRTAFRVTRFNPETGEKYLADGDGNPSPRPLLGVRLEEPVADQVRVSTTVVNNGVAEGWITLEGAKTVSRPGGPRTTRTAPSCSTTSGTPRRSCSTPSTATCGSR
jgi:hypothetical protein